MYTLTASEERFARIIWMNEPLGSGELVMLCRQELGWKKSTTYTVLKKLCSQGLFRNAKVLVSALVDQEVYLGGQSVRFVEERFQGFSPIFSRPSSGKKLTRKEAAEDRCRSKCPRSASDGRGQSRFLWWRVWVLTFPSWIMQEKRPCMFTGFRTGGGRSGPGNGRSLPDCPK